jgi:alkaline phosphatase D
MQILTRRGLLATAAMAATGRRAPGQSSSVFAHGVASGDPLPNRVILWTRLTPAHGEGDPQLPVEWALADDPAMRNVYQAGRTYTNSLFDYTVKVDATRLQAGATYYYQFSYGGAKSPIGRTRTLPLGAVSRLRLGVASCANYPYGFFNAYRALSRRDDLDAVLHLGDYLYEYANGRFGDGSKIGRVPLPDREAVTLDDYRQRYAQYRADADLQEVHRQHPFIAVWDDHEFANDAWADGAENHRAATQGDWYTRRAAAEQAWLEWMPVRENFYEAGQIYRSFRFGDLADLVMLDTRLAGRMRQLAAVNTAGLNQPARTLLGADQESWFLRQLSASQVRGTHWRLVGQQILMANYVNRDGLVITDHWDGYPAARQRVLSHLANQSIGNVVVLTGDIHSSWANEISTGPTGPTGPAASPLAVEFVTPAVTSPNIEDAGQARGLEAWIRDRHPHVKYVDVERRGYLVLDIDRDRTQAEWHHMATVTRLTDQQELARVMAVASGDPRLQGA